jgi:hypothetical protein
MYMSWLITKNSIPERIFDTPEEALRYTTMAGGWTIWGYWRIDGQHSMPITYGEMNQLVQVKGDVCLDNAIRQSAISKLTALEREVLDL